MLFSLASNLSPESFRPSYVDAFSFAEPLRLPITPGRLPENPLVSVLITNYNYAEFISSALESLLRQTYGNWEAIVVDDGSTDESARVVHSYCAREGRIRLLTQTNQGQAVALNRAFRVSQGEVICFLDSDDRFYEEKLRCTVEQFKANPQCGFVTHYIDAVREDGKVLRTLTYREQDYVPHRRFQLRAGNPFPPSSGLCFRRDVLLQVLPLPATFRIAADGAVSAVAGFIALTRVVSFPLAQWVQHGRNSAGAAFAKQMTAEWLEKKLTEINMVQQFARDHLQCRFGFTPDFSAFRPAIEIRLSIGVMKSDEHQKREALSDLRRAYNYARLGYPAYRYLFWNVIARVPSAIAKIVFQLGFRAFRYLSRTSADTLTPIG